MGVAVVKGNFSVPGNRVNNRRRVHAAADILLATFHRFNENYCSASFRNACPN